MSRGSPYTLPILLLTPMVPLVGLVPGGRWIWPLLAPLTIWRLFRSGVLGERYGRAVGVALAWAMLLSIGVIVTTVVAPAKAASAIVTAEPYRAEMFRWIETGQGAENEPAQFIPLHLMHLGLFVVLGWVSAGYLGLALGAWLVGYMSFFVGSFAAAAEHPLFAVFAAWVPWSVVRVISFVLIGTILARPLLLGKVFSFGRRELGWLGAGGAGIVVDIALKAFAAPWYGQFLRSLLPGAGG